MQKSQRTGDPGLLSARQVQLLLHIDRSTVYRMAADGRLPAIRVGRQWRFPEARITALLGPPDETATSGRSGPAALTVVPAGEGASPALQGVPAEAAAAVVQVAADLLGVMMVVTDMDGRPLTDVANPCPWFAERAGDPDLLSACITEWQHLADDPDLEPRFSVGPLGFECARAFVRRGTSLVGMVLVGGVAPAGRDEPTLYRLDPGQRRTVLAALPKVAAALSHVAPREPRSDGGRSAR